MSDGLAELERRRPEWAPWLAVVGEVLGEAADPEWDAAVPRELARQELGAPLLARATLHLDGSMAARSLNRLFWGLSCSAARAQAVLRAALNGDEERLGALASDASVGPETFRAVAALLPVPLLHACRRRWASAIPKDWWQSYCPVCGTWPAFAEICGVERGRYLRCSRCGCAWQAPGLACPYCGTADHEELASLVAEQAGPKSAIDVCKRCLGYLKTFTTLRAGVPSQVIVDDLASVELDLVALERGYRRPQGPGYALDVTLDA